MSHPSLPTAYLPMDRRWALFKGEQLPEQVDGAILVSDIGGFTQLGEELAQHLGGWQGAEELNRQVSACFADLIAAVHAFGGSVVRFSGDALLSVFYGEPAPRARATATAQAIQEAMRRHSSLSLRMGLGAGTIHRRLLGDLSYGVHDLVSGPALSEALAALEQAPLGGIAGPLVDRPAEPCPWPERSWHDLPEQALRPWVPPVIYDRLAGGSAAFVAELRQVVPLFIQMDCSEQNLLDYVPRIQEILVRHGTHLNEVEILDKGPVMVAFFGAPVARGDDPIRATGAALAIVEAGRTWAKPVSPRIGLSMGPLYAGLVGSPARLVYTLYGDEMNVAARLMGAAGPGQVLTSTRVRRAAEKRYCFTRLGMISVKGRSEPVSVAWLEGEQESPLLWQGAVVGRRSELARLDALRKDVWAGHNHVVVLSGEAGIGKSRLAAELVQRWQEQGGWAYAGHAQAMAQQQAYFAWNEILRQLFGLLGDEQDEQRLEEMVAAVDPALLPRLPLLGDILGLPITDTTLTQSFDARLRQASTQALIVDLLKSQKKPLLILLEDTQWFDGPSWALTLAAARGLVDRPILLCLTRRPIDPSPSALLELSTLPTYEELVLGEFSPEEAIELAHARLGGTSLPAELATFLQAKGQGNPFFIEEILHTLQEEGFLQWDAAEVVIRRPLDQAHLPDNVQGVVLARIDRLDEPSRLTLKVASVIGRVFAYPVLREVHPVQDKPERLLSRQLDQLEAFDIVLTEVLTPEPTYIFKHAITHEVAYGTLLFSQRRDLHGRIAGYYERQHQDHLEPYYPLLVHHYGRSGDEERQVHFCQQAGQEAARRYANAEAISFYSEALEILGRRVPFLQGEALRENRLQRWDLLERRADLFSLTGQRDGQQADIEALFSLAQDLTQPDYYLKALLRRGHLLHLISDYDQAQQILQEVSTLAEENNAPAIAGRSLLLIGQIAKQRGYYQEALDCLQRAQDLYRAAGDEQEVTGMLNPLGLVYYGLGEFERALAFFEHSLQVYQQTSNYAGQLTSLYNIGFLQWDCGQYKPALERFLQALTMIRQIGNRYREAAILSNIGDLYRYMGKYDQAIKYLQQAITLADEMNIPSLKGESLNNLGLAYLKLGDLDLAEVYLQQALQIRQSLEETASIVEDLSFLAQVYLGQGKKEQALAHSRRALEMAKSVDLVVNWEQEIHYNHYLVCQATGLPEEATQSLQQAYRSMLALAEGMPPEGQRVFLEDVQVNREIARAWEASQAQLGLS